MYGFGLTVGCLQELTMNLQTTRLKELEAVEQELQASKQQLQKEKATHMLS